LIWIVFFLSWYLAFTGYMIVMGYSFSVSRWVQASPFFYLG